MLVAGQSHASFPGERTELLDRGFIELPIERDLFLFNRKLRFGGGDVLLDSGVLVL